MTTLGYGDLHRGGGEDDWYTDRFSGTSSAAPIVAGVVACLQGVIAARGTLRSGPPRRAPSFAQAGPEQQDGPNPPASQRIGPRPDLSLLLARLDGDPRSDEKFPVLT